MWEIVGTPCMNVQVPEVTVACLQFYKTVPGDSLPVGSDTLQNLPSIFCWVSKSLISHHCIEGMGAVQQGSLSPPSVGSGQR